MSNKINDLTTTRTQFNSSPQFNTAPPGTNNTTLATTEYVQTAFPTGNMTLSGDQTLSGQNTFNTMPTISTINGNTAIQIGNTTDSVYLGTSTATTLSINGIVQSLVNFIYFCVGSNSTAGASVPANVRISQKLQAGSFTPTASATVITYNNGTINTPFSGTPAVVLTEKALGATPLTTMSNHWISASSSTGFTANVATTPGRTIGWVAIGP